MHKKTSRLSKFDFPAGGELATSRRAGKSNLDCQESMCQKSRVMSIFGRITSFFGTDFAIIANLIRSFGSDSRMDRSDGNLNLGFSMKNYPDFNFPNIIPASAWRGRATRIIIVRTSPKQLSNSPHFRRILCIFKAIPSARSIIL